MSRAADPAVLISRKTGDWWKDHRRNWCAYCGVRVEEVSPAPGVAKLTRDHVIPRAHKGRHVTIPFCEECNRRKGTTALPQFMLTKYFGKVRKTDLPNKWPLSSLWLVMAWAAVEQAREQADFSPTITTKPGQVGSKRASNPPGAKAS